MRFLIVHYLFLFMESSAFKYCYYIQLIRETSLYNDLL